MFITYDSELDAQSLRQGDVLRRTEALEEILAKVHPHYLKPDYRFFMVVTQSCDLFRRDGKPCSAPYITIAAVRPLELAIERFADKLLYHDLERQLSFASEDRKAKLQQFVERLLNNNELGYFFLHSVRDSQLSQHQCAFLHLTIALKKSHYDTLLGAKILQLKETFQHKLGYLLGTTYSRVGTEDWVPSVCDEKAFSKTVTNLAKSVRNNWIDKKTHRNVMTELATIDLQDVTESDLADAVKRARRSREQKRRDVLSRIEHFAESMGITKDQVQQLNKRLENDPKFMQYINS